MHTKAQVILYSKTGCHLCEVMRREILASGCESEYTLEEVNIETDAALMERYRLEIPVLTIDGVEAFKHRLSAREFRLKLREMGARHPEIDA